MPQSVKFVDRPGGTVLLDVSPGNSSGLQIGDGGVVAPPPPVLRSFAANPVADGGTVGAQPYGMRTVTLPLAYSTGVRTTTALQAAARRTAATTLMRVTQMERFWLEVIADGATEARYLSCYRVSDDKMVARISGLGSRWLETSLDILADPFAYGPKETLSALTHNLANDFKQTIAGSGIKGDVPAPCIVTYTPPVDTVPHTFWMASRVGGSNHKCVVEFSALTNGTAPSGSTFTAGAADASRSFNGTADLWSQGTAVPPATMLVGEGAIITTPAGTAGRIEGQYRVFLLTPYGNSDNSDSSWRYDLKIVPVYGQEITLASVTTARDSAGSMSSRNYDIIDFGVVEVPYGGRAVAPGFDAPANTSPATLRVYATLLTNPSIAMTRYFDALLVLPADDTMMNVQWASNTSGRTLIVDPHSDTVLMQLSGVNVGDATRIQKQGSVPYVVPGVDVAVYAFSHVGGVGLYAPLIFNATDYPVTWTPSYWPRYLTVV